ncbi:hypothetical protein [Weissella confusa]|nr:hypothetical protein [Weissella confusa]
MFGGIIALKKMSMITCPITYLSTESQEMDYKQKAADFNNVKSAA